MNNKCRRRRRLRRRRLMVFDCDHDPLVVSCEQTKMEMAMFCWLLTPSLQLVMVCLTPTM